MRHPSKRLVISMAFAAASLAGIGAAGVAAAQAHGASRTPVYRFGVVGNRGPIVNLELRTPARVPGISGKIVQIATSNSDGYARTSTGAVYAWGVASDGELGNGTTPSYSTRAVRVDFPAGVKIVKLGNPMPFDGALAIDSHGRAWGWGLDAGGDLCQPGQIDVRPTRIPLAGVTLATGALAHSLFDSHGKVYACGSGEGGVLGNGSTTSSSKPTAVRGLPSGVRVMALTSSWEGSGALLANGAYYDWGYNAAGQLGDGKTTNSSLPVHVILPAAVRQVSQGGSGPTNGQTIAILKNGTVWDWGNNQKGQLGNGTVANSSTPVRVHVPKHVSFVKVNSGGYACYAIDTTGRLWDWGDNREGQLGRGSDQRIETRPVPVNIRVTQVSSTAQNVAALNGR